MIGYYLIFLTALLARNIEIAITSLALRPQYLLEIFCLGLLQSKSFLDYLLTSRLDAGIPIHSTL